MEAVMGKLDGRVALITGGARGQGRSHALALAAEGAEIVVADIAADVPVLGYPMASKDQLAETVKLVEDLDRRALGLQVDARDTAQVQAAVDRTLEEFGRIDILLANHGIVDFSTVENTTDEAWNTIVDTNLTGIFKAIRAVIPPMRAAGYGRIVATSSMGARNTSPNLAHYIAAKWGVIGLVKSCALEVKDFGITVNAIAPGAVNTDLFFNQPTYSIFCPDIENPTVEDFEQRMRDTNKGLNGRAYLEPEHVSRAVLYLVTDDGVITGQVMEIGLGGPALGIG
jgi:SDR family mycofactocin-dependent oxidoreductase